MSQPDVSDSADHNLQQRRYFERFRKATMIPVDSPYLGRHVDELLDFASITPGQRVLEVGCGMGRYTFLLANRNVRVEGLDLSPVLLQWLREYDAGRYNIPVHCTDVIDHPVGLRGQFEAVVGFFTLHHVHDLGLALQAMGRLLRPGGRIAFLEPNPYNPLYYAQILMTPGMSWQGEKGLAEMRPGPIFRAMEGAGLRAMTVSRFGFFPPSLTNRSWGRRFESLLERVPIWRPLLPFQLFLGRLPERRPPDLALRTRMGSAPRHPAEPGHSWVHRRAPESEP